MSDIVRVNFGCAHTPLPGWINCDNSLTLRISRVPALPVLLRKARLISEARWQHIQALRGARVLYVNALKPTPFDDSSVDVIYTSHMINCFDRSDARVFLTDAHRILKPGGIIRIAVPDLRRKVDAYLLHGDADVFIDAIYARRLNPKGFKQRLAAFLTGYKLYLAQDDGRSLSRLLGQMGFADPIVLPAGESTIQDSSGLDLFEHSAESLYVEAIKK